MNNRNILPVLFIRFLWVQVLSISLCCTSLNQVAGTSSGVETRVMGMIVHEDGTVAPHTAVQLVAAGYDPVKDKPIPYFMTDTTDAYGRYEIPVADSGNYNILAVNGSFGTGLMIKNIRCAKDTVNAPTDTLHRPGAIRVMLPDTGINDQNGYIYIPGTTIYKLLNDNNGSVLLTPVPAGTMPSVNYSVVNSAIRPQVIRYAVMVTPGDTAVVFYPDWKYSRRLVLNTTASGAGVAGNVTGFPVLVRLTADNFNFDEAGQSGSDIRFTKQDNTPLPYEIEQWDAAGKQAAIWVRIDTVYGNNSTQSIIMYWGTTTGSVTSLSNGVTVFDTGASGGFKAVLHLGSGCSDATGNKNNGTNFGATDTAGIIGGAKQFSGSDSIKISGLMNSMKSVTLSAWICADTALWQTYGGEVISIGDAVLLRADEYSLGTEGAYHYRMHSVIDSMYHATGSGNYLAGTGWRYVTFTVDNAGHVQRIYIDGRPSGTAVFRDTIMYSGAGINTLIGTHGNGKSYLNFYGGIDEVRIESVARSTDWIKLCYMNQKALDAVVEFR